MKTVLVPKLTKDNVTLIPWTLDLATDYYHLNANPLIASLSNSELIDSIEEAKKAIKQILKKHSFEWAICLNEGGDYHVIGNIALRNVLYIRKYKSVKELGYFVAKEYWNRGYATKAVNIVANFCYECLHSDALLIRFGEDNIQSQKVAENNDFFSFSSQTLNGVKEKIYIKIFNK